MRLYRSQYEALPASIAARLGARRVVASDGLEAKGVQGGRLGFRVWGSRV